MADITPLPDERLDTLQLGGFQILQKRQGFRFGMDAVLLADFARVRPGDEVADFGTGTGILPLLLLGRGKGRAFHALEVQPELAEMAQRTMRLNRVEDRIRVYAAAVEEAPALLGRRSVDAVICNPPYGQPGRTMRNPDECRAIARHLDERGLAPWFEAACQVLRDHGRLALVYPAAFMLEALAGLRESGLAPKRFRLVYPAAHRPPNLLLVEAVKGGRPPLQPEPPLIVRDPDGQESAEIRRIYGLGGETEAL